MWIVRPRVPSRESTCRRYTSAVVVQSSQRHGSSAFVGLAASVTHLRVPACRPSSCPWHCVCAHLHLRVRVIGSAAVPTSAERAKPRTSSSCSASLMSSRAPDGGGLGARALGRSLVRSTQLVARAWRTVRVRRLGRHRLRPAGGPRGGGSVGSRCSRSGRCSRSSCSRCCRSRWCRAGGVIARGVVPPPPVRAGERSERERATEWWRADLGQRFDESSGDFIRH